MSGKLVLCATPIGNLEDLSARAARTLREARVVACEDTRRTRKLYAHLGADTPELIVVNEITERRRAAQLVERIARGESIVLVTDAGVPGLSDPGFHLVRACAERDLPVEIVPGPDAAVSALAVSGLPPARFVFEGFLARRPTDRRRRLKELVGEPRTLVFFESPHRVADTLADMLEAFGDRPAALVRELTKLYEQTRRGTLASLLEGVGSDPARGEIVLVVGGAPGDTAEADPAELAARARELMAEGVDRKEALQQVARAAGVPKRVVFDALLEGEGD